MRLGVSGSVMKRGALLFAAALLASCTVVVDEPRPLPPGPGPDICTRIYDPVCARRGPDMRSFPNACEARSDGYRVVYPGTCRGPDRPDRPDFCTREYAPVCARRRGDIRTFGNACEAESAGYRIINEGRC